MRKKVAPGIRRKRRARGKPFEPGNTAGLATRFPKGVSGNVHGRPKYAVASQAARALLASPIPDDPEGRLFAEGICHQLGWMALGGDRAAAELLFDRAEGRAPQAIEVSAGVSTLNYADFEGWTRGELAAFAERGVIPDRFEAHDQAK